MQKFSQKIKFLLKIWQFGIETGVKMEIEIRAMNFDEINFAVDLASKEGWNPGLNDAFAFYNTDPEGFLIGFAEGKPVACISAVSYENKFGFIGFYIVVPEYRGKGLGIKIWNAAMEKLKGQNIGLDGVIAQQENYKKSGFKLAYSNIRFESVSTDAKFEDRNIVDTNSLPFEMIADYDKKFSPADRTTFIKNWLKMPQSFSFAFIENDQIKGYGVIRKCGTGYKVGPLFAEITGIAEKLFLKLSSSVEKNTPVYLDVPEVNSEGMKLAEKYGMKKVFGTARMYTGEFPNLPINKIFGVTTFELG